VLEFKPAADGTRLIDAESLSTFDLLGRCTDGPLKGRAHDRVIYSLEEWYIWVTQHPESDVFRAEARN
jgi:hypothetical protein